MIDGKNRNTDEKAYREILMDSASSLKDFCLDRKLYFRRYIMSEVVEEKFNQSILMGQLVDLLLLEPEKFDDKFAMSSCISSPTGLMLEFCEALYRFTKEATNDEGEVTRSFEEISRDAYTESGYKLKYEAVIGKFLGSDAEIFYDEIRKNRPLKLLVVTAQDITNAERIVEELKNNPVTKDIVNLVDSVRYKVFNQFQIEGYDVDGHLFKAMIDKIIVDTKEKTVQVYDLKCTFSVEEFYRDYYLYRRAYIQAFLYYCAAKELTKPGQPATGYTVLYPRFIVCDSINYYSPLIFILSEYDIIDAYEGFEHKGNHYPGVKSLIQDLQWALDNNTWNISRENSLNNGIVKITGR